MAGLQTNRIWVYTQSVTGRFQRLHRWSGRALMAFLVLVPWIPIGGHPMFLIDVPHRRMYALGTIFTASDGFLIALMGFFAAFALFFFTALFGRLWCGYACPQTVFLEEFIRPIERFFEGERGQRRAADEGPWTGKLLVRKAGKQLAFAAFAVFVSMCFTAWFAGPVPLWSLQAPTGYYAIVAFFAGVWYFDFAYFREQFCNYLCPYARFQGALCDDESLVVAYDTARGEPRGGAVARKEGHCIDCDKCVAVCPAGIDIREGFQLECVMCGNCIDACEGVMGRLGHASLIGYGTAAATEGRKPRLLRPRTVAYASMLCAIAVAIVAIIARHAPLEAHITRASGPMYTVNDDGEVQNIFMLDVTDNDADDKPDSFKVTVTGLPDGAIVDLPEIVLSATERRTVPLVVRLPAGVAAERNVPFTVTVSSDDGHVTRQTTLLSPGTTKEL